MDYHERKDAEDVLRRYRRLLEEQAQLASLLSCEPGDVLERVREIREALQSEHETMNMRGFHCRSGHCYVCDLLAPSRPASEPAEHCPDHVFDCCRERPEPAASGDQQAQAKPSEGD